MAMRLPTDCRSNARLNSAAGTSDSLPSSIFTYPPRGKAAITHSVRSGPKRRIHSGRPKPTEKRRIFTPARRATM
jgi:hypothetical protein